MGRRLTTSLHDDDACKAIPDDMPEFCSDLDEHIPVICQLMARKAQAKTQTDPARKLPSSMTRLYELAMNEFEVTKLGTRPNVVTLLELLDARESKVNDYPGDNGWDILIRRLVTEEISNYLGMLQYRRSVARLPVALFRGHLMQPARLGRTAAGQPAL